MGLVSLIPALSIGVVAEAGAMSWPDATAVVGKPRTKAETRAAQVKKSADAATVARAEADYETARAEVAGVIEGLITADMTGDDPGRPRDLTRSVKAAEAGVEKARVVAGKTVPPPTDDASPSGSTIRRRWRCWTRRVWPPRRGRTRAPSSTVI